MAVKLTPTKGLYFLHQKIILLLIFVKTCMSRYLFPNWKIFMIERLEISHYRSCVSANIQLQPDLSVLIGPNGSGKTNILKAFLLLRNLALERPESAFRQNIHEELADECRLRVRFSEGGKSPTLTAALRLLTDDSNSDVVLGAKQTWSGLMASKKRTEIPLWVAGASAVRGSGSGATVYYARMFEQENRIPDAARNLLVSIAAKLSDIKYYSASQFTNPSQCPTSFEIEQDGELRRGVQLRGHSKFLYDLHSSQSTTQYEEFKSLIGPDGVGLVDNVTFQEIRTSSIEYSVKSGGRVRQRKKEKLLVVPQFVIGRNRLSPNQLSEGTFKTIALMFYLVTQKSSVLLVEEPEVCVHHGLLASIMELIKIYSKDRQIVISTHSDFVLDQVEPRHVYRVSRSSTTGTKVTSLEKSVSARSFGALKKYLEKQGNLGEYWRHGGLD